MVTQESKNGLKKLPLVITSKSIIALDSISTMEKYASIKYWGSFQRIRVDGRSVHTNWTEILSGNKYIKCVNHETNWRYIYTGMYHIDKESRQINHKFWQLVE